MSRKKADPAEVRELAEVFRDHGAADPESWARSQLEEGIPQLAIFCFCKALWQGVIGEEDDHWIDEAIKYSKSRPNDVCTQAGSALVEILSKGVSRSVINDLVRVMQYEALFHACALLDGSWEVDLPVIEWTLQQVDENGRPVAIIQGLHEVLLSMDPTGREMRPRESR